MDVIFYAVPGLLFCVGFMATYTDMSSGMDAMGGF